MLIKKLFNKTPNFPQMLLLLILLNIAVIAIVASQKTQTKINSYAAAQYPNFKGLILFSSGNSSADAASPYLVGTNLQYYWSQLEPNKGQYNWSVLDSAIQPWATNGKKVVIRIATSGWKNWGPPYSQQGTPQWVYNEGVRSTTANDGAVKPEYWNPTYLQELQTFIAAYAAKYDGNPNVAYVQIAIGDGGETKVDSTKDTNRLARWQAIGYTDAIWWSTVQKIMGFYKSSFKKTPLALLPDATFIGGTSGYSEDMVTQYASSQGIWLQEDGLLQTWTISQLKPQWLAVQHPMEQRNKTANSGDTLQGDIQAALNVGANYILIFAADIDNPANASTLQWARSLIASSPSSAQSAPTTTPITPSYVCAGSPNGICPTVTPTPGGSNSQTNTTPKLTTTPAVSTSPCTTTQSVSAVQEVARHHHHHKHKSKNSNDTSLLKEFLSLFQQLIELIDKLLGNSSGTNPTPTQTPAPSQSPCPTVAATHTPIPSNTIPTTAPTTAQPTPTIAPSSTQPTLTITVTNIPTPSAIQATPTTSPSSTLPTSTPAPSNTLTLVPTNNPTSTPTVSGVITPTVFETPAPTLSSNPTEAPTPSNGQTPTNTPTPSNNGNFAITILKLFLDFLNQIINLFLSLLKGK